MNTRSRKKVNSYNFRNKRFNLNIKLFYISIVSIQCGSESEHVYCGSTISYRAQSRVSENSYLTYTNTVTLLHARYGGIIPYEFRLSRKGLPCPLASHDGTRRGSTSQPQSEINLDSGMHVRICNHLYIAALCTDFRALSLAPSTQRTYSIAGRIAGKFRRKAKSGSNPRT